MKHFLIVALAALAVGPSFGETNDVYSNEAVVKGWKREPVSVDTQTGKFIGCEVPSYAETVAASQLAEELGDLYDSAAECLEDGIEPIRGELDARKERPVVMLVAASSPDNALDRQNLTMCVVSNEIRRINRGFHVDAWVYGNRILTSRPIMEARVTSDFGQNVSWSTAQWDGYGNEDKAVSVTLETGTYETYRLSFDVMCEVSSNLTIRLRPWVVIGKGDAPFKIGNRTVIVNGEEALTTNSLDFIGTFFTTNGTPLVGMRTFADKGLFKMAVDEGKEDDDEDDE